MKRLPLSLLVICACALTCCHNDDAQKKAPQFPRPGTTVAKASMPVTEESLNHFMFSVSVVADSSIDSGVYDVDAEFGPNFAEGQFTMPAGCRDAKPVIRKGDTAYTYIVGFKLKGDSTFYDYFEVSSSRKTTKMRYIKSYTF